MLGQRISDLKFAMMPIWRRRRMSFLLRTMKLSSGARVLDVGGLPALNGVPGMWELIEQDFKVTLLNVPGSFTSFSNAELRRYEIIEADACDLPAMNRKFDLVFSNSVIEHVGDGNRQSKFAEFVRGSGKAYWVQTPSPSFPLEAHCNMPFWWHYPPTVKQYFGRAWARDGNEYLASQMTTTLPISSALLKALFPGCSIYTERLVGFSKSIVAYGRSV